MWSVIQHCIATFAEPRNRFGGGADAALRTTLVPLAYFHLRGRTNQYAVDVRNASQLPKQDKHLSTNHLLAL
jgi:hypothetical protein